MKGTRPILLLLALTACVSPALAVDIHKCKDNQGNITYERHCPPGTTSVEAKHYATGTSGAGSSRASGPLTLYVVPDCDSCKQVEDFLAARGISVDEKNVNDDIDLQNELKEAAGDLRVPALKVGDDVIVGYNRTAMLNALSKAGFNTEVDKTGQ